MLRGFPICSTAALIAAIAARAAARLKGEAIEIESSPVAEGEPSGEEIPLEEP
jgi:hypothetical protein